MVAACLIATTMDWTGASDYRTEDGTTEYYDLIDGPSEEEAYLQGQSPPTCGLSAEGAIRGIPGFSRRVQDHPAACRRSFAWEDCETPHGPSHRRDARCPELEESSLRVRSRLTILGG
jgi:hypothetical protein